MTTFEADTIVRAYQARHIEHVRRSPHHPNSGREWATTDRAGNPLKWHPTLRSALNHAQHLNRKAGA